jgi:hypothetical protein
MRDNGYEDIANSYETQRNMLNINIALQLHSPASKIFSAKIGFTVHRSHFDGSLAPRALSRGFNKSRGSFPSQPAAAESHGIKEIYAAPVNLGLLCGTISWQAWRGNHEIYSVISTATRTSSCFACFSYHHVHVCVNDASNRRLWNSFFC